MKQIDAEITFTNKTVSDEDVHLTMTLLCKAVKISPRTSKRGFIFDNVSKERFDKLLSVIKTFRPDVSSHVQIFGTKSGNIKYTIVID